MFGISFGEIFFVLVIALIVLGPKQLARVLSKFWLLVIALKSQLENIKSDLYQKSGMSEIKNFEHMIATTYHDFKANLTRTTPNNNDLFIINESILYQPELDFDREPELFDEIYT